MAGEEEIDYNEVLKIILNRPESTMGKALQAFVDQEREVARHEGHKEFEQAFAKLHDLDLVQANEDLRNRIDWMAREFRKVRDQLTFIIDNYPEAGTTLRDVDLELGGTTDGS